MPKRSGLNSPLGTLRVVYMLSLSDARIDPAANLGPRREAKMETNPQSGKRRRALIREPACKAALSNGVGPRGGGQGRQEDELQNKKRNEEEKAASWWSPAQGAILKRYLVVLGAKYATGKRHM